jgi:hypothetical protein
MESQKYTPSYIPDRKRKKTFWEKLAEWRDFILQFFHSDRDDPNDSMSAL